MKKEEALFLSQLIKTLEESERKLEEYYNTKDYMNFKNIQRFMFIVLEKIFEVIT